jgi:hypothetical protein
MPQFLTQVSTVCIKPNLRILLNDSPSGATLSEASVSGRRGEDGIDYHKKGDLDHRPNVYDDKRSRLGMPREFFWLLYLSVS